MYIPVDLIFHSCYVSSLLQGPYLLQSEWRKRDRQSEICVGKRENLSNKVSMDKLYHCYYFRELTFTPDSSEGISLISPPFWTPFSLRVPDFSSLLEKKKYKSLSLHIL